MDSRQERLIQAWLGEDDNRDEFGGDYSSSDSEENHVEEQLSDTGSEQEIPGEPEPDSSESEIDPVQRSRRGDVYLGVDNTVWSKTAPLNRGRTRSHNIVFVPPGPKGLARQKITPTDCMSLFLDDNMIDLITKYTNIKIDQIKDKYQRERDAKSTNTTEMRGFIRILLMTGVLKINRLSTGQIFEHVKHTGIDAIYLTMSEQRFKFLLRVLRFNDIRQQPEGPFRISNERSEVVMRVAHPVFGKNINITMDNWFSSLQTAKQLFENGTTMVGTMRKDKREVPLSFREARRDPLYSSKFGFHPPCTLVSYKAKPNKIVILMSIMHNDAAIDADTRDKRKPEIISYYNRTKNGVDLVDKICSLYDVSRNSKRWPVTVFYNLINLSALNALCISIFGK
ncbi:hypothetical protein HF086_003222 [Spodoptera exigua]|uniref:PiggyBac transposable element-derived protein domain-containing protein n=1 Tax=Spodoptera exigua TaxID=7107 RepID=A0A922MRD8_SPOEX|nr:hypothetical protein HF086_003222 [Spodoptera exigua]